MERRKFLLTSGTALIGSTAITGSRQPVIGLDFELSAETTTEPSIVDSILVNFQNFELLPKYIDEDAGKATITITLDVENQDTVQYSTEQQLTNGEKVTKDDIGNMIPLAVDGIDTTSIINGEVRIDVEHQSVSDSFKQSFFISGEIPNSAVEGFEDGSADDWDDPVTAVSSTSNGASPYSGNYTGELEIISGSNKQFRAKNLSSRIYPTNISVACRIENVDNQFDRQYVYLGPFFISLDSGESEVGIGSTSGNTGVSLLAGKWYNIEFNGINWESNVVYEVLINSTTAFTNYGFSGNGVTEYQISAKGGSTFQSYIDSINPS